jgi:hypothetical protein
MEEAVSCGADVEALSPLTIRDERHFQTSPIYNKPSVNSL